MEHAFWLERWRVGKTGFHQTRVTPLLQKYWITLGVAAGAKVLVPLAGKSLDMVWLAQQGYEVLGVELSPLAVEQFFIEQGWTPTVWTSAYGRHYAANGVELICGDIFGLDAALLSQCVAVYDRAALIALPERMRMRYVQHVYAGLAQNYAGLLLTLDYDQSKMEGPPFAVSTSEVQALYTDVRQQATLIDSRDILAKEPKFVERGLRALHNLVFRVEHLTSAAD